MKAELYFDLENEDDKIEFSTMLKAADFSSCLWDTYTYIRELNKYQTDRLVKQDGMQTAEEIYEKFFDILDENNTNIDEIA